jgi:hypothetical protein
MMELLPEDEALLARAREGLEPGLEDHARIKRGLFVRIAAATAVSTAATTAVSRAAEAAVSTAALGSAASSVSVATGVIKLLSIGVLGAAVVGGGLVVAHRVVGHPATRNEVTILAPTLAYRARSDSPMAPALAPAAPAAKAEQAPPPPKESAPLETSSVGEPKSLAPAAPRGSSPVLALPLMQQRPPVADRGGVVANRSPSVPMTTESPVELEADLLTRADSALKAGDANRALELVNQHASSFPQGVLVEEREAERIVVLCALGRSGEAETLAAEFLRQRPRSPLAPRVRASCGAR